MKETPILFTGEMVRAILSGTKSQTRRVVKPQPISNPAGPNYDGLWSDTKDPVTRYFGCPYFQPGDRLWVRESHQLWDHSIDTVEVKYVADGLSLYFEMEHRQKREIKGLHARDKSGKKITRPPMFMFRWASRITLELTAVRVERVQDISVKDALAEGVFHDGKYSEEKGLPYPVATYKTLWDSINGKKHSWASNPWVWVLTFKRI